MTSTCEVCSAELSKYRCPACGLASCSLVCSQSHKVYCKPKTTEEAQDETQLPPQAEPNSNADTDAKNQLPKPPTEADAAINEEALRELVAHNPALRAVLRDIYQATREEEWVEIEPSSQAAFGSGGPGPGSGRGRGGRGRGKTGRPRSRGPWTPEKGFNRGLGKVRKYRQRCEEGSETGAVAEGFVKFVLEAGNGSFKG